MKHRGFTIIELLVVVAIIGLLTAAVLSSTSTARTKSRDARRLQDMREIETALNLYYQANNSFPLSEGSSTTITGADPELSGELTSNGFMPTVPTDPQHPTNIYQYISTGGGTGYYLQFCLETNSIEGFASGCDNYFSQ